MTHPANAIQAGVYTRLTGYSALATALGGTKIYDHVPQGTSAPYVLIGEDTLNDGGNKTHNGWECTITIHSWDYEKAGRKSVKAIMGHIYDALHRQESNLTITGFSLVYIECEFEQVLPEQADGATDHYYHGVQRFRALITETT